MHNSSPGGFGFSGLLIILAFLLNVKENKEANSVKTSPNKTDFGGRAAFGGREDYFIFD